MTLLYLLRHGAIESPHIDCFIGHTDVPLSDLGRCQIDDWRGAFSEVEFVSVWSSDLLRALQTVDRLFPDRAVRTCPDLREINLGDWDGKPRRRIRDRFPEVWKARGEDVAGFRPPAGESFTDVLQRVTPCIGRICSESSGPVLVVTHAGVIRVLICKALGMPISGLFRIRVDYGGLTLIDYHENEGTLIFCNMLPRIARVEFESFSR